MKRVIVEFKKLNDEIMNLLAEKFPYGYDDEDIITFKNMHGEEIEAVEVRTDDTIYLVKVGKRLKAAMEDYDEEENVEVEVEVEVDDPEFNAEEENPAEEDDVFE